MAAGETIIHQRIDIAIRQCVDAAAAPAVTTVRAALLDIFLAAKASDAVAAFACEHLDFGFIYELHDFLEYRSP